MPLLVLRDPAGQADSLPEYHGYLLQEFSEPEELIQAGLTLAEGIIVIFTGDDVLVQQLRSAAALYATGERGGVGGGARPFLVDLGRSNSRFKMNWHKPSK